MPTVSFASGGDPVSGRVGHCLIHRIYCFTFPIDPKLALLLGELCTILAVGLSRGGNSVHATCAVHYKCLV